MCLPHCLLKEKSQNAIMDNLISAVQQKYMIITTQQPTNSLGHFESRL